MELNKTSLDTLCSALTYVMGIPAPEKSNPEKNEELCAYADKMLNGKKADRIFMFNPDAIAQWIYEKYPDLFAQTANYKDIEIPFRTVMPSVTPVCFGTMYTGAMPEVHGILKYEKPVLKIDTIFDALIRAGKKGVIVASKKCSIGNIFLERDMDYFLYDSPNQVNAKASELIIKDEYDFYVVYNGNYDTAQHKNGPENVYSLSEIQANCRTFAMFNELIKTHWTKHDTLVGFAMDHGCHEIDGGLGSHGLDMPEDLNITHFYKIYTKAE